MSALSIESVGSVSTDIFLSFEILSVIVVLCVVCVVWNSTPGVKCQILENETYTITGLFL